MNRDSTASEWIPGAPHEDLRPREQLLPPEADPFYQPPRGYRQAHPGTVRSGSPTSMPPRPAKHCWTSCAR